MLCIGSLPVAERNDVASRDESGRRGRTESVFGHEKICRIIDRGQLNNDPDFR